MLDNILHLAGTLRDRFSPDMTAAFGPMMSEVRNQLLNARGNLDPLLAALDEIRALRGDALGSRPGRT